MSVIAIVLIALSCVWIVQILSISPYLYSSTRTISINRINQNKKPLKFHQLNKNFNFLNTLIGERSGAKLIISSSIIVVISCFIIGPFLTDNKTGWLVGIFMATAYIARIILHMANSFRGLLLSQIQRILYSIRNNLSTGATLDNAVNTSIECNQEEPLGPHLKSFIKISGGNFIENFPKWLKQIQGIFRINELSESAQLLALQLQHTNNQESAFMSAATFTSNREKINKKQKNTLLITMITMDFLILCFLWIVFFIIPQINEDWWLSPQRIKVMLQSSILIWGIYSITIFIALGRQA